MVKLWAGNGGPEAAVSLADRVVWVGEMKHGVKQWE